tara:strand:+ start:1772 stop:2347 length:576 start_codon:yes stop_codon:yes gene_type:complete
MTTKNIINAINESKKGLENLLNNKKLIQNIEQSALMISETIKNNSRIFSCGNGGSMCDSMHFAEELSGRFRENRRGLPCLSISDPSYLTCVGNDFGFEYVFSRFLEANAIEGDLLLAISTSGKSKNIVRASEYCMNNKMKLITLTGKRNSEISKFADIDICTPNGRYSDRVQEIHTLIIHILVENIENFLF